MDDSGIENSQIAWFCHYTNRSISTNAVQQRSYLTYPPLDAVVQWAGDDPKNIKQFNPMWDKVTLSCALLSMWYQPLSNRLNVFIKHMAMSIHIVGVFMTGSTSQKEL